MEGITDLQAFHLQPCAGSLALAALVSCRVLSTITQHYIHVELGGCEGALGRNNEGKEGERKGERRRRERAADRDDA